MAAVPRFTCIYCPERHISGVHHRLNFSLRRTKHDEHALFRLLISLSQTRSTLRPYAGSDNALEDRHRLIRVSYRRKCSVHPSRLPGNELQAHLNSDCATRLQRQERGHGTIIRRCSSFVERVVVKTNSTRPTCRPSKFDLLLLLVSSLCKQNTFCLFSSRTTQPLCLRVNSAAPALFLDVLSARLLHLRDDGRSLTAVCSSSSRCCAMNRENKFLKPVLCI